jgi:prophage regulatory protein
MAERFLSIAQVLQRVPVTKKQVYVWIRKGIFPRQVRLGPRAVAWRESDVDAWSASRQEVSR